MLLLAIVLLLTLWGWQAGGGGGAGPSLTPDAGGVLFRETFQPEGPTPGVWETRDRERKLVPAQALLEITGGRAAPGWGDPGMYSRGRISRQGGRTLAVEARTYVGAVNGPLFLLAPRPFPGNPWSAGYGSGYTSRLGDGGNGGRDLRLAAVTPGGEVRYGGYVAENHNYLFATTMRPQGSYHFVSGGALGTFPEATLIWVSERGGAREGPLHVGVDSRRTHAGVGSVRVVDLPGAFATQDGLAVAVDTFTRPVEGGRAGLGRTPQGGFPWRVEKGEVQAVGTGRETGREAGRETGLTRKGHAAAEATLDPGLADGLFELTFATPRSPFADLSFTFRRRDERHWWRVTCNEGLVQIERAAGGQVADVYRSGAYSCGPQATHRLVVRAHGEQIGVWLNDRGIGLDEDGLTDPAAPLVGHVRQGAGTELGIGFAGDPAGGATGGRASPALPAPAVKRLAVWPQKVVLPALAGPLPPLPDAGASLLAFDRFRAPPGTRLQGHRGELGGSWTEQGGEWTITPEGLRPPAAGGLATIDTGATDVSVTTTVRLAGGEGWGTTNGWQVGPVLRYSGARSYLWARFLFQRGSPEVELWERRDGITRQLNAKNITGLVAPGGTHSLRVAAEGERLAVYVDGAPVAEATTSILHGTRTGLVIDDEAVNVSTFTAFEVRPTYPTAAALGTPFPPLPGSLAVRHPARSRSLRALDPGGGPGLARPGRGPRGAASSGSSGGQGGAGSEAPAAQADAGGAPAPVLGVPQAAVAWGVDVEDWWAGHPFNPERPEAVPVGGIASPEPVLDVAGGFGGNVQAAIDALPPSGGTLFFAPGTYTGHFILAGRSNVHFVSDGGATLQAGAEPVLGRVAGCQLALDYGNFVRGVRLPADSQHGTALACAEQRARNIYFRDLTFDGAGRARTGVVLSAVADVVFDRVTFTGFVDPREGHGGLLDGSALLDNVWCRECRFAGRQRWALYLDGLHGGGVLNSRIEDGFAVGGFLFLTNDDFTRRRGEGPAWEPGDQRTGAYIVVYGNTFAGGSYQAMGMAARHVLIKGNVAEGPLPRGFAGFDTKSSMIWPDLVYEYFGNKVIGNRTQDVPALVGFGQARNPTHPGWNNRAQLGRYTVRDNVIENASASATLVYESGSIAGPNIVERNCLNGRVYGTSAPCPAG